MGTWQLGSILGAGLALWAGVGLAQSDPATGNPPPFPSFTFRSVTPPAPDHDGPRIDIRITGPEGTAGLPTGTEPSPSSAQAWFWSIISAAMPPDPARFWAALALLETAPETSRLDVPRLTTLTRLSQAHGRHILRATVGTQVSPALVISVMAADTPDAPMAMRVPPTGAVRHGRTEPDIDQVIADGVAYLDDMLTRFDRDPVLALAAYRMGEATVLDSGGVPEEAAVRDYVPRVLATWVQARALCLTPPELISDGCVFRIMPEN